MSQPPQGPPPQGPPPQGPYGNGPHGNQGPQYPQGGQNPGNYPQQPSPYNQQPGPYGGPQGQGPQEQGPYGGPPQNPNGPQKSGKNTLWIILASILGAVIIIGGIVWALFAFVFNQDDEPEAETEPTQTELPSESPTEDPFETEEPLETDDPFASTPDSTSTPEDPSQSTGIDPEDLPAAMEEREQFFKDQSHPPGDPSLLTAKTDEQQAFLDEMHDWYEDQGMARSEADSPEMNHYVLATALNMCEQSILDGHNTTPESVYLHVTTSPVIKEFASLSSDDKNEAYDIMAAWGVRGTRHICNDDYSDWDRGYKEADGDWGQ